MSAEQGQIRLHGPLELASAELRCWSCQRTTPVHALLAADVEEFAPGKKSSRTEEPTFVHSLDADALPPAIVDTLRTAAPNYQPIFSRTAVATLWSNACVHCGTLQRTFYVHAEPHSPFFGGIEGFTGKRSLLSARGFDVDDASYSG